MNKLSHLLDLKDGWYNGEGTNYNKNFVDKVEKIFNHYIDSYPDLIFYPSPNGNIYIETTILSWIISIDIDVNLNLDLHIMALNSDIKKNFKFNLEKDYNQLNLEIEKLYEEF